MLREASRIALPRRRSVHVSVSHAASRRHHGPWHLCGRRSLCSASASMSASGCSARGRTRANAWQGWGGCGPIWRLPALWTAPWDLGRTGVADFTTSPIAPACFSCRSFPSTSPCSNPPCPACLFFSLMNTIAPVAAFALQTASKTARNRAA